MRIVGGPSDELHRFSAFSGYRRSFPVLKVSTRGDGGFTYHGDVYGTCFSIGDDFMITAGHVARRINFSKDDSAAIALTDPDESYIAAPVIEVDFLAHDIAILRVQFLQANHGDFFLRHKWTYFQMHPLDDVQSWGFAYGHQEVMGLVFGVQRAFKGYVVCNRAGWQRLGTDEPPFPVYELSFQAPRGLSGAPLLNSDTIPTVFGVVIGNSESRMLVRHSTETEAAAGESKTTEHYEILTLGIAVRADAILKLGSKLLKGTVGEQLKRNGLLAFQ